VVTSSGFAERLLGAGCVCALLGTLAAIDGRVRDLFAGVQLYASQFDAATAVGRVHGMYHAALHSAWLQAPGHSGVLIFGLAGVGLTILMLRT
jgi:hypothetical protein